MAEAEMATATEAASEPTTAAPDAGKDTGAPLAELFQDGQDGEGTEAKGEDASPSTEASGEGEGAATSDAIAASDIVVPEGHTYDEAVGEAFLSVVNDGALSRKEMAQKLVDLHAAQMGRVAEALAAAEAAQTKAFEAEVAREREEWLRQCKSDAEYGGRNWDAAQAVIDRGARQLATPEAVALLQRYGLNTHPELVRMFWRAGKLAGEDESGGHGGGGGRRDPAEAIFGDSLKGWRQGTQKGAGQI